MTRILVIDDAEPLRKDLIELLSYEGFDVMGAENGIVGVEVARHYRPDLIICDVMMPEMNGYQVLDVLRADARTDSIPFIFLTARTERTEQRYGMGLGADDYLTKPYIVTDLLSTIKARLDKQQRLADMVDQRIKSLSDNIITALPHELRTPLNTVIGFSEMLISEAGSLDALQVVEWSRHINDAGQRLYRMVENYLIYVRIEIMQNDTSQLEAMRKHRVDFPDTMVEFHALHNAEKEGRQDDLKIEVNANASVRVSDQDIGKITDELVDNALKFSDLGSSVKVTTSLTDKHYVLTVEDKGRGMTAEQVASIGAYMQFERWFYEQQGSGLGLTIVRRLVELYGGDMLIESEVDQGTKVTVRLALMIDR